MRLSIIPLLILPTTLLALTPSTTIPTPSATDIPAPIPDKQYLPGAQAQAHALLPRQGVGAAGGIVPAAPSATQMSPTTTYMVRGPNGDKTPMPYTQLFSKIPEQWPSPTAGEIGLGTIQGVVGVVKTNAKRAVDEGAVPTDVARVAEKFRVLKEALARRQVEAKSVDINAGARVVVERFGLLGVGVLVAALVGM